MKLIVLVLVLQLFAATLADEMLGIFRNPEFPGKCVYADLILSPGEQAQPKGKCERFICSTEEGFGTLQGCGKQGAGPSCESGDFVNPNGPYPDCCSQKTCVYIL